MCVRCNKVSVIIWGTRKVMEGTEDMTREEVTIFVPYIP